MLLNIINNDNSDAIRIVIRIIKDNTPVLNCAHVTSTRGDYITRNANITKCGDTSSFID